MILSAHWVLPISAPPIRGGAVLVRRGEIAAVGSAAELRRAHPREPEQSFGRAALLPGFVNAHTHLDYSAFRSQYDDLPFFQWLQRSIVGGGGQLTKEDFLASARLGAWESLRSGITTIADSSYTGAAFTVARAAGLRGIFYQEVFGYRSPEAAAHVAQAREAMISRQGLATDRQSVGVSPHAPYSVTRQVMALVHELIAREPWPVSVHAAESEAEVDFVRHGRGVFADDLAARGLEGRWTATGGSPVHYLAQMGMLGPRTIVAHAVQVDVEDIALLAGTGSAVAHCAKSNAKLGVGVAPLLSLLRAGVRVGLGTDSAASNNKLDMFEEMRFALLLQRARARRADALTAQRVLSLATLEGARALGLDDRVGSLTVGKRADVIAVSLEGPIVAPVVDPGATLVHTCTQRDVLMTMVDGEVLYEGDAVRGLDAVEVERAAQQVALKLAAK